MQEALEWRRVAEANGNLTRRFEETRTELEKTLRVGQACLTERGDPAELFSKHSVRPPVLALPPQQRWPTYYSPVDFPLAHMQMT